MAPSKNILLGIITKIHGFEGAVAVRLEKNFSENIPRMESVFLEIEGKPVPFFIDFFEQLDPGKACLRFQDYNTIEKVREFIGCNILIPGSLVDSDQNDTSVNLTGFKIVSEKNSPVGSIIEVIKNPAQWLLRVKSDEGAEILIPLHEDLIIEIDERHKKLKMIIPEGLGDINQ